MRSGRYKGCLRYICGIKLLTLTCIHIATCTAYQETRLDHFVKISPTCLGYAGMRGNRFWVDANILPLQLPNRWLHSRFCTQNMLQFQAGKTLWKLFLCWLCLGTCLYLLLAFPTMWNKKGWKTFFDHLAEWCLHSEENYCTVRRSFEQCPMQIPSIKEDLVRSGCTRWCIWTLAYSHSYIAALEGSKRCPFK